MSSIVWSHDLLAVTPVACTVIAGRFQQRIGQSALLMSLIVWSHDLLTVTLVACTVQFFCMPPVRLSRQQVGQCRRREHERQERVARDNDNKTSACAPSTSIVSSVPPARPSHHRIGQLRRRERERQQRVSCADEHISVPQLPSNTSGIPPSSTVAAFQSPPVSSTVCVRSLCR
jgi:hypothetical protein